MLISILPRMLARLLLSSLKDGAAFVSLASLLQGERAWMEARKSEQTKLRRPLQLERPQWQRKWGDHESLRLQRQLAVRCLA